jgi:hypothetical protein
MLAGKGLEGALSIVLCGRKGGLELMDRTREKEGLQYVEVQVVMSAHAGWGGGRSRDTVSCLVGAEGRAGVDG